MNVLVCGGFGFAGHYLVYKLLKQGYKVILLGRNKKELSIKQRLEQLKVDNSLVNPDFHIDKETFENIQLVSGDISKPNLGIDRKEYDKLVEKGIYQIFNMAAFLRYEESYRSQVFQVNVEGVKNLLELATLTNAKYLHASTAYIASQSHPDFEPIKEEYCHTKDFTNVYIESKCCAELLIKEHSEQHDLEFTIFRFPMLIGDSQTGYTNSVFGFYEYIAALTILEKKASKNETIRVKATANGTLNLVPTDLVIDCMLEILKCNQSNKTIFNLTDDNPISLMEIGELLGKVYNLNFVIDDDYENRKDLTETEKLFNRLTLKNKHFANREYVFDTQNTTNVLGHSVTKNWDRTIEYFTKMANGFLTFSQRELTV